MRHYKFSWDLIGNIDEGRPHLGIKMDLDIYRLMQFTLKDVMEEKLGTEETDALFYSAGKLAGKHFYTNYIEPVSTLEELISKAQKILREKGIGILKIEESLLEQGKMMLTIDEDLDCSGLPEIDYETCVYDEGFVAALFESFTKKSWSAKEIDCWCTGARTCRFMATEMIN